MYSAAMNRPHKTTLDEAVAAARALPEAAQELIAAEIMESVEDLTPSKRSPERQAIIKDRLAKPLKTVSREELTAMLRKYDSIQ